MKLIFLAASPLVLASFARVFAASPLSGAPDKTAMLCRLQEYRHGDDNFSCRFKYSCPSGSPIERLHRFTGYLRPYVFNTHCMVFFFYVVVRFALLLY